MYLSHFGFPRQPFNKIAADFFYGGANRGATLDKILYVLTHGEGVEGIIQVVGETGSGKTTLCRLLMSRLPANLKTIYLAKPDLSREELFQSIADELKFELPESDAAAAPTIATLCERQGALIEQHADGRQLVLLLDEAHTLPMETLEALRLLYELESSRHKLLQIVLLGQTKLKTTLALPQMRQFRACVTDHFIMQPFDAEAVREYLILRMRAAGYRGPEVFTPDAIRLIVMASGGLIQQIDTLADKSLLAASAAHNRDVREQHVREAVRNAEDSGIRHRSSWRDGSSLLGHRGVGMGAVLAMAALSVLGWQVLHSESTDVSPALAPTPVEVMASVPVPPPIYTTVVEKTAPGLSPPVSASAPGSTVPAQSALPPVPPVPPQAGTGKVASAQGGSAPAIEQHSN
ncbi:MAG: AAA family ATPase, partial [Nitrosospira sp.]|nr:AAA family ATPase [Nitrosospira sp.]